MLLPLPGELYFYVDYFYDILRLLYSFIYDSELYSGSRFQYST